jgi:hypothetical protein
VEASSRRSASFLQRELTPRTESSHLTEHDAAPSARHGTARHGTRMR